MVAKMWFGNMLLRPGSRWMVVGVLPGEVTTRLASWAGHRVNQRRFGAGLAAIETLAETAGFLSLQHFARGGFAKRKISPRRRGLLPR